MVAPRGAARRSELVFLSKALLMGVCWEESTQKPCWYQWPISASGFVRGFSFSFPLLALLCLESAFAVLW